MKTINPLKRNMSSDRQIKELKELKSVYVRERSEKQLEIDVINSKISSIEAQIANILIIKRRTHK